MCIRVGTLSVQYKRLKRRGRSATMLGVIACFIEVLLEVFGLFVFIGVPFIVIGLICEFIKRLING